jgi:hypothetical protein
MTRHQKQKTSKSMKTDMKRTGTKDATVALAEITAQIEALNQQRIGLAQPLKDRYTEMGGELVALETEIRSLDANWKPTSLRPKAEEKIAEVITTHGSPMTIEEIGQAVNGAFSAWKLKNVLKKKSTGPKAIFSLADGKYSLKSA